MSSVDFDLLSTRFRQFAERECRGSSPLYEQLATAVAADGDLLALAAHAPPGQPTPNLLFAAVHCLLLAGNDHPLRAFYASISSQPDDFKKAPSPFKDFCTAHSDEIIKLLQTRRVQTNEVRRCAYLYPAFCYIHQCLSRPLALIELGTAAGLNLIWDRYAYDYGKKTVGATDSDICIHSAINGPNRPPLATQPPPVASRLGLDVHVVDLRDDDQHLWLRALIWPEHTERVELMSRAAKLLRTDPPELIEGDAVELLTAHGQRAPQDAVLCVYHTHVANQFGREKKERLFTSVDQMAEKRAVCHIYNNMQDGLLHLDMLGVDQPRRKTIAKTDGNARWFEWMPDV